MERKYQETTGYFVYAHITPNGMYYIGMSKQQPWQRWKKTAYKTNSLAPYIEKYGWENIEHKVLIDGLTKEQAEQWEDKLIVALSMNGLCINKNRSGRYVRDDIKQYNKQYREEHQEEQKVYNKQYRECHKDYYKQYYKENKEGLKTYMKEYNKQRLSTPEWKIYNRVSAYNRNHTPIETPLEAKRKYLEWGYMPAYIKSNDLL